MMESRSQPTLRIGVWSVDPATNQIARDGEVVRLEARTMRLLLCLAERAGQTVSVDELMDRVWSGTVVTQDSIYQAVASLRRVLGDDPKTPTYIATVPRRGYRLVAKAVAQGEDTPTELAAPNKSNRRTRFALSAGALVVVLLGAAWWIFTSTASAVQSVAVLPFLDLTSQAMNEEYFADGMTEELIDRLSRLPGLRVPPPTASFYFKGKRMSVGEIAKALNVSYVLDGSVRRAGATMRVAVRLVRADDGFIVWSQTYDRESPDLLQVQDDIAAEVARTLEKS